MKVLFVSSGNINEGISPIIKNQGESLKANGVTLEYFAIEGKGFKGYFKNIFKLSKFLKPKDYDIVHAHYSLSGMVAALSGAKSLVVSLMGSDIHNQSGGIWRVIIRLFQRFRSQATIVKSQRMKDKINLPQTHVIPNGVDLNHFKPIDQKQARKRVGFDPFKKMVIFVANPNRYEKNFSLAQKAYTYLNREDVELHTVYDIDYAMIPYFMNAVDVLLLTSLWEGSPNVIKEAMACNCPIVSTDVGDVNEVIGKTEGCHITSFDPGDVAEKLRMALSFGHRTNGREHIRHLDSNLIAKKIIKIYEDVHGRKQSAHRLNRLTKIKFKVVKEINRKEWAEFVLNHPRGNVFQGPEIFDQFQSTNNYEPIFLAVINKDMKVVGVLMAVIQKELPGILGYISSRTIVFGGPLIEVIDLSDKSLVMEILLSGLIKIVKFKSIYIQFRNFFDVKSYEVVFKKFDFKYLEHLNYIVDTSSRLETEKRISKSKLRQVRKSLQSGAKIIEPVDIEQVKIFYHILKDLYRTKVKRPLPDWSFFKTFYQMSKKGKIGKYFLVEFNREIIGGIMCPITKRKTIYESYICGLDGKYKDVYPSVLATWAPIDYALENGLKYFDFMGAGQPDKDYGVREFKSKFGGKLVKYGRFERINNKPLYIVSKLGLKILGALKR